MPIVILTGLDDEAISRDAVKAGAQDYLVKGLFDGGLLSRSLFYAIERARFREELMKARDDALQAAKLKSEFLAIISHEMRTPMNAIIGPVELLIDTPLDQEQTELANTALTGSRAMLALIDDILDYSRLAGGELRMREVAFELVRDSGRATRRLHRAGTGKRSRAQQCATKPLRPLLLAGDPARLGQVLVNLIGNAIKFTEQGEVSVSVTCESETAVEASLRFHRRRYRHRHRHRCRKKAALRAVLAGRRLQHSKVRRLRARPRHRGADRGTHARGNRRRQHPRKRFDVLVHRADAQGAGLDAEREMPRGLSRAYLMLSRNERSRR